MMKWRVIFLIQTITPAKVEEAEELFEVPASSNIEAIHKAVQKLRLRNMAYVHMYSLVSCEPADE